MTFFKNKHLKLVLKRSKGQFKKAEKVKEKQIAMQIAKGVKVKKREKTQLANIEIEVCVI